MFHLLGVGKQQPFALSLEWRLAREAGFPKDIEEVKLLCATCVRRWKELDDHNLPAGKEVLEMVRNPNYRPPMERQAILVIQKHRCCVCKKQNLTEGGRHSRCTLTHEDFVDWQDKYWCTNCRHTHEKHCDDEGFTEHSYMSGRLAAAKNPTPRSLLDEQNDKC